MHGPGIAQPPPSGTPSPGMLAFLRVIFVGLPLLTCGFLAWAATLRVAIVTRSALNWWLVVGNVALCAVWVYFLAQDDTDDFSSPEGNIGVFGMLFTGIASVTHFLFVDIRHYAGRRAPYAGYYPPHMAPPYQPPAANSGYGYGGPTRPMAGPQQQQPQQPQPPYPQPGPQPGPANPAPSQPNPSTPPPRIDQVRAELDELSDLLRRDSGEGDRR
ncbi:hypothetical protein [Streptomyces sp. NBC_01716]|uniref:hypothetical protein n=1 Tax=Streptomyces sp. NBC_01716 TaxID=2975917 RepID=UPI002E33DE39|nr:hypothetical protein [Streptomyces sp. NBC_01716]